MKIVYDDIVYSLQKVGGVSVVWSHITSAPPFSVLHIWYDNAMDNVFADKKQGHVYQIVSSRFLKIKRYLNPIINSDVPFLFHSSYYRFCNNPNAINITTVHDFIYELYRNDLKSILHKLQKKKAVLHSDGIICISESTKRDFQKIYPDYQGEIRVIYNGYDTQMYYYEKACKEKIILFVGGRARHKRFDYAVEIMRYLPYYKLIIVGGGKLTNYEKELLEKTIPNNYEKIEYIRNDELRKLYNKAFCLLYCSDYEGFGIPPIEAQACGCPVICQAKSSIPEVVADSAIFFDPNNIQKLISEIELMNDNEYYQHLVDKGLANAQRFSWEKCKKEVYQFYYDILELKFTKEKMKYND